jgi:hypothetical protein
VQHKFEAINSSVVDFFHRQQLIQQVFLPLFNHIFIAFGHDLQWGRRWKKMIIKLLWTRKREGQVHRGRTLIAKKTSLLCILSTMDSKVFFSKEIAVGLVLYMLRRINIQQNVLEGQKTFIF